MQKYEFLCGGDHGAWECLVDVELTDDEICRLSKYGKDHEFLDWEDPVEDICQKVFNALESQCRDNQYLLDDAEYEDDEDEDEEDDIYLQDAVIRIPYTLRDIDL